MASVRPFQTFYFVPMLADKLLITFDFLIKLITEI